MRILELQDYANRTGVKKFTYTDLLGNVKSGEWIDSYFGMFRIEGMPDNKLIHVRQWRDIAGDLIEFEPEQ